MTLDVLLITTGALGVLVDALSARIRRLPVSEPLLALVVVVLLGPWVLRALLFHRSPPTIRAFRRDTGSCW
jgi:hypothetical protein